VVTNLLKYKNYYARIAFDPSADAFHGRVIGIQDVIDFYGRTPDELRKEFKHSVEEYLAWCAEEETNPEKTWPGKLTIRVDEDFAPPAGYSCVSERREHQYLDHHPPGSRNHPRAQGAGAG
jgi:predicted HicB family RNase H-like nuclease